MSVLLIAGSPCERLRSAAIMGLLQTAKPNGHDPRACGKDVTGRLPTWLDRRSQLVELLPGQTRLKASGIAMSRRERLEFDRRGFQ